MKKLFYIGAWIGIIIIIALLFYRSGAHTFGAFSVTQPIQGGTGTSTKPNYGEVLVGNSNGGYDLTATSSLGISSTGTDVTFSTTSANYWSSLGNGFSTTSTNYWKSLYGDWSVINSTTISPTTTLGINVHASSTIGAGGIASGLTIYGSATTTGSATTSNSFYATTASSTNLFTSLFAAGSRGLTVGATGLVGVGSSTPFYALSVGAGNGSTTKAILVTENRPATSTSMTIDWKNGNSQLIKKGTAGITLTFTNWTEGANLRLNVCNPDAGTGGTLTWPNGTVLLWPAGTAPTQTTTAGHCDVYSFEGTNATGTPKVFGSNVLNF